MSMPIQGRFSCCAAAIVVPQPQNGTATGVKRDDQEFPEITEILVFSRQERGSTLGDSLTRVPMQFARFFGDESVQLSDDDPPAHTRELYPAPRSTSRERSRRPNNDDPSYVAAFKMPRTSAALGSSLSGGNTKRRLTSTLTRSPDRRERIVPVAATRLPYARKTSSRLTRSPKSQMTCLAVSGS